jgi:hypothetical protein
MNGIDRTICQLYQDGKSIPDVHSILSVFVSKSMVRLRLIKNGIDMRSRKDGIVMALDAGRRPSRKGIERGPMSNETKKRLSISKIKGFDLRGRKGTRITSQGYCEFTSGPYKGRMVHRVMMEKMIGRSLATGEVVHHINENRADNNPLNLQLTTPSSHSSHHAIINAPTRARNSLGQFSTKEEICG